MSPYDYDFIDKVDTEIIICKNLERIANALEILAMGKYTKDYRTDDLRRGVRPGDK